MSSAPAIQVMPPDTPHAAASAPQPETQFKIEVQDLNVYFRANHALRHVTLGVLPQTVLAVIGPSGCGKSTFIRALNRMHDLVPGARVEGKVFVDGKDLYARGIDPVLLRRRVGMA